MDEIATTTSPKAETAIASADAAGDDAPEVKPAVLRMTPDDPDGDGDEPNNGDAARKPDAKGEGGSKGSASSPGRSKATLSPARP